MTSLIGQTLSHYRISAAIGTGGMGEVYRATDTKLGRDVALKVLPAEMAASPERLERFQREAKALAALDHPGIVTVHSVEEADGVHFLTMQLVEGQPLDRIIPEDGLPVESLLQLGSALADALAAAHEKGIVHRDLKPANVMVTRDGGVKILDFGLAKVAAATSPAHYPSELPTEARTREGLVMGTVPYMSPEQVQGRAVDQRTDIFSLGVMLYEMASGRRPFAGDNPAALMSAILKDAQPAASAVRAGLPEPLARAIDRCLAKDPGKRPPTAREVAAELRHANAEPVTPASTVGPEDRRLGLRHVVLLGTAAAALAIAAVLLLRAWKPAETASAPGEVPRLAVLPFADLSPGQHQELFAAGTHEALLTALQQIGGLRVTSRRSSMRYRGSKLALPEIARELKVRWLVEGSVTRADGRVRVAAQLVEGATDQQVWAGQYERDVGDILALQSEVAGAIAAEVHAVVTPEEERRLAGARRVDPGAYRAYVRGLHHFDRTTPPDFRQSIELFQEAISLDPAFAPAQAALAFSYGTAVEYGWISRAEAAPRAERALTAVERLDPGSADAYHALANVQFHIRRDFAAAEESYRRTAALESSAYVFFEYGWLLSRAGRYAEAVAALERAVEQDPRSPLMQDDLGWWLYGAGQLERASAQARLAIDLDPSFPEAHWLLAAVHAEQGRFDLALPEFERYESLYGKPVPWFRGYLLALAGRHEEALRVLTEVKRRVERGEAGSAELAQIYLGLGDRERVLETLEQAREPGVIVFEPYLWPEYQSYHADPRFLAILERLGLPKPPDGPTRRKGT